ncbi:response regulator [Massilia sp. H-1]|nr:response regulator [Massilia sp. H-1]
MPGMDGYQVCRALKQSPELREVPVIFLSAFDDTDDKLRGFDAGAVDFISKPYHFLEVKARVSAHLKLARLKKLLAWQNDNLQQLVETKADELARAQLALLAERQQRDQAERESQQRLAEIAHMNRNASASVCSAALVHELNQPLAAILSNAEAAELFLRMDPPQLGEVAEILGDIRRDDLRASELIKRMRATLRKSEAAAVEIDLGALVRTTVELLAAEARGRKIALRHEIAAAPLPVAGDPVQLQQVMVNLLLNGMDAMQDTGPGCELHIVAKLAGAGPGRSPGARPGLRLWRQSGARLRIVFQHQGQRHGAGPVDFTRDHPCPWRPGLGARQSGRGRHRRFQPAAAGGRLHESGRPARLARVAGRAADHGAAGATALAAAPPALA